MSARDPRNFCLRGIAASGGIAIGRAVLIASSRVGVAHDFITSDQIGEEVARLQRATAAAAGELQRLRGEVPRDAPVELAALLDVHLMLLQDEDFNAAVRQRIRERLYNAEWAVTAQMEIVARQFDGMQDEYLRERKADLEQVVERLLRYLKGAGTLTGAFPASVEQRATRPADGDVPLVLVAHDLSPADMLQFRKSVFCGFVTDVGGKTSHTAIVARGLDIPAVVGARGASDMVQPDDWIILDGETGVLLVDPAPDLLAEYGARQRRVAQAKARLAQLINAPSITRDGQRVELLANIERPSDAPAALAAGTVGVGLFRSEFLFMGRQDNLPGEEEQLAAYRQALDGMQGLPVTIRTVDVGADKPLDDERTGAQTNPALGLRAIRWSLAEPEMFLTQLRAILRAAAFGPVRLLIPMLGQLSEIRRTRELIARAREQLDQRAQPHGPLPLGAMIEVPAAALSIRRFLPYFDFMSIGTNDLVQYTLAIDRADEAVAHLFDPLHPAVLGLIADVIAACDAVDKSVSVCGEMAGDPALTHLLLGLGLRRFSMHPAQLLAVKQQILRADARVLSGWARRVVEAEDPASVLAEGAVGRASPL
ncbi:MAG: phosphoenolpyruvate--protein phosphotransferase [Burkholderiaceae bacterium]|jgi:phosphotransferase system enzyme I (PtsI)|nr:phosphoenolpyruvate--protein phosphotransferase [Burkholderiaceae bacterium]